MQLLGGPGWTGPRQVGFSNPGCPVGLISTMRVDLTFDRTSLSGLVFRRPFGPLVGPDLERQLPRPSARLDYGSSPCMRGKLNDKCRY